MLIRKIPFELGQWDPLKQAARSFKCAAGEQSAVSVPLNGRVSGTDRVCSPAAPDPGREAGNGQWRALGAVYGRLGVCGSATTRQPLEFTMPRISAREAV
jgi:hypothetical protein